MTQYTYIKAATVLALAASASIVALSTAAQAGDSCQSGFVWRETSPTDHVCAPPMSRDQARLDNKYAATRVNEVNHDYGPDTCVGGFVWREAFEGDHVCVRPEVRAQSAEENRLAASRVYVEALPRDRVTRPVVIARQPVDVRPVEVGPAYVGRVEVAPVEVSPAIIDANPVEAPAYIADGQQYDWSDNGWNGAGFYAAGMADQLGNGFGGRDGFHGWHQPVNGGSPRGGGKGTSAGSSGSQGTGKGTSGGYGGSKGGGSGASAGKSGSQGGGTAGFGTGRPFGGYQGSGTAGFGTGRPFGGSQVGGMGSVIHGGYHGGGMGSVIHGRSHGMVALLGNRGRVARYHPYGGYGFSRYGGHTAGILRSSRYLSYHAPAFHPVRVAHLGGGFNGASHMRMSTPHFSAPRIAVARVVSAPHFSAPRGGGGRRR